MALLMAVCKSEICEEAKAMIDDEKFQHIAMPKILDDDEDNEAEEDEDEAVNAYFETRKLLSFSDAALQAAHRSGSADARASRCRGRA